MTALGNIEEIGFISTKCSTKVIEISLSAQKMKNTLYQENDVILCLRAFFQ